MDRFREALEDCSLTDLGFMGDPFTWCNNCHNSDGYIRERLDRAVADIDWRSRFPSYRVINGEPRHSDHRPIIVVLNEEEGAIGSQAAPAFRFEAGWAKEEECATIVENAWKLTVGPRAGSVEDAVREVAAELLDWSRNVLGDLEKRIKRARRALEECRRNTLDARTVAWEEILKYKLEKLEEQRSFLAPKSTPALIRKR
ncbi:hypothetical protein BAE44_0020380 [Dichanthelium oligosanthes]|uniref:Endonuclease/exonuclease/phosphatase domain-containing protein n=1 Tax=Dichanthelium oligosanthes TaxID=888268 RepID=A0A1E5V0E9_9POAL|nr:hypothetical protein BAE44_0020380 [Dichanthelium oligosanthes]